MTVNAESGGSSTSDGALTEFRGAWIPTVNNIDWPSSPGLSVEQQKFELIELLDIAQRLNMNVIVLQVRTACDALYDSPYEPWSEYLTGKMGRPPEPWYDPLEFAVNEAHKRNMELHAWFNPYRARYRRIVSEASPDHVSNSKPELVRKYGKHLWLDPGEPESKKFTAKVILDVLRRYDIDGVHFDDYFYPYPENDENGEKIEFDDKSSYRKYLDAGGELDLYHWRRMNVNDLIHHLSKEIRRIKPHVSFGISPFGIWRPGHPPEISGFDQYDAMWADPLKWLQEGWIDYLAPQLYWPTFQEAQSYEKLLAWWISQNTANRLLLTGNATYRVVEEPHVWGNEEYMKQMKIARDLGADGSIHYFLGVLKDNPDLADELLEKFYQNKAVVPSVPDKEK